MTEEITEQKNKKYLFIMSPTVWERLSTYREKYNADSQKIGPVSFNNIIETAIKQFLDRVEA
jgi:hypothetical protein